jgi:toxin FitB
MYLLDTNVLSELRKIKAGEADKRLKRWANSVDSNDLYLSAITVQEIDIGVLLLERQDPIQAQVFRRWLEDQVLPAFGDRVLPVDISIARKSALFHIPNPKPMRDSLIAATAAAHSMIVVTRNVSDFDLPNVRVFNPWN